MTAQQATYYLWDVWVASWALAALWSARTLARAPAWSELWRDAVGLLGAAIIIGFAAPAVDEGLRGLLVRPLWRTAPLVSWLLVALTAASFAFCWWARLHLGRLWSGLAVRKADHRVVDSGPYRLVRHPIYTGILGALAAMALLKGTALGLAGLALAFTGLWLKARLEEGLLRRELGEDAYDAYSRRTPMLIPWPQG